MAVSQLWLTFIILAKYVLTSFPINSVMNENDTSPDDFVCLVACLCVTASFVNLCVQPC